MLRPLTGNDAGRIGPYELRGRIGAGGMGVVYLGFDGGGQPAAVKVPAPWLADDPEFRRRFGEEVAAARRVSGGSVAAVVDFDLDTEQPWLATEYVEGSSLAEAVTAGGAFTGRHLDSLAAGLGDALAAIHAADVVHRDLKPGNILLAWDGPKVIDFGIARAGDATRHTRTGAPLGTPVWMAPEQLRGERAGPAADIFAWGTCVAFAASGRPPFRGEQPEAVAIQIMTSEPDLSGVPDPLAAVVRHALTKDPALRPTAADLQAALAATTDDGHPGGGQHDPERAVAAMPAPWWSLQPTPLGPPDPGRSDAPDFPSPRAASASAAAAPRSGRRAFVAGLHAVTDTDGSSHRYAEGSDPRGTGEKARRGTTRTRVFLAAVLTMLLTGGAAVAVATLGDPRGSPAGGGPGPPAPTTPASSPGRGQHTGTPLARIATLDGHTDWVKAVAFSPDGRTVATAGSDTTVVLWDVAGPARPARVATLTDHTDTVWRLVFSPDGRMLATVSNDKTAMVWNVSDPARPHRLAVLTGHSDVVDAVAFSSDGHVLATGSHDRTAMVWNMSDPARPHRVAVLAGHTGDVRALAFLPGTHVLVTASSDTTAILWDVADQATPIRIATLTGHTDMLSAVAFSSNGRALAVAGDDETVTIWDTVEPTHPNRVATIRDFPGDVYAVAFSPDGRFLATGSSNDTDAVLWNVNDPARVHPVAFRAGHDGAVLALSFAPDGRVLATAGDDKKVVLWTVP